MKHLVLFGTLFACACGPSSSTSSGAPSLWSPPPVDPTDLPPGRSGQTERDLEDSEDQQSQKDQREESGRSRQAKAPADEQVVACDTLCWLTSKHCRMQSIVYDSLEDCQVSCLGLPEVGQSGDSSGNTVYCRVTYALLAKDGQTMLFCHNASASGGTQCQ